MRELSDLVYDPDELTTMSVDEIIRFTEEIEQHINPNLDMFEDSIKQVEEELRSERKYLRDVRRAIKNKRWYDLQELDVIEEPEAIFLALGISALCWTAFHRTRGRQDR